MNGINLRAATMLALKAASLERNRIPVSEVVRDMNRIAKEKGRPPVGRSAIEAWLGGHPTRFDEHIILAWCDYLPCTPGQLLGYDDATPFDIGEIDLGEMVAVALA